MSDTQQPTSGERLAKRVAAQAGCSRLTAEQWIENGWVSVHGQAALDPATRVPPDTPVTVDPAAHGQALRPVQLLWHKPVGVNLTAGAVLPLPADPEHGLSPWHVKHLRCITPLPAACSGLAVFVQDKRLYQPWLEMASSQEQEWMLDAAGPLSPDTLAHLSESAPAKLARAELPCSCKLSLSSQQPQRTRLRLALKHHDPALLPAWWADAATTATASFHRLRIGRLALGALPAGAWRLMQTHERL